MRLLFLCLSHYPSKKMMCFYYTHIPFRFVHNFFERKCSNGNLMFLQPGITYFLLLSLPPSSSCWPMAPSHLSPMSIQSPRILQHISALQKRTIHPQIPIFVRFIFVLSHHLFRKQLFHSYYEREFLE